MPSDLLPPPIDIPEGWRLVRLRDICSKIGSGATPTGGQAAYLTHRFRYAFVRSQNVYDRRFSSEGLAFISDEQASKLMGVELRENDILLNITGDGVTFGRACLVDKHILPACVNQHVSIIRVDPKRACPDFVLTFLTHPSIKEYIESFNAGGSRRAITKGHIEAFVIPLPPIEVQREIGSTLQSIDDKIALLRDTNATLEAIAKALFKSWFVDFDPVRTKAEGREPEDIPSEMADLFPSEFEESEAGLVPKGWRWGTLGDVSRSLRSTASPDELDDDTAYIGLEHMPRQSLALDSWEGASKVESGKSRFKRGQILFGKLRPYFHKVGIAPVDGVCSTDIVVIEPKSSDFGAFCVCHFSSKALIDYATQLSNGAKMPRVNWKDIANFKVILPPTQQATAFDFIAKPMFERIVENVHSARALADLRDALLPRLMSGKLRVEEVVV